MHKMTEQNLINAFSDESQAHLRYGQFADIARDEKFPQVERLFRAIAHAEFVHAGDHYRELRLLRGGYTGTAMATFGPGSTRRNLDLAIAGEDFEINEMYPAYIEIAALQKEAGALRSFQKALGSGIRHKLLLERAREAVEAHKDFEGLGALHVCKGCGYTAEDIPPGKCPLCDAGQEAFIGFKQKGEMPSC